MLSLIRQEAGRFESVGNLLAIEKTLVSDSLDSSSEDSRESLDSLIEILAAYYTASIVCLFFGVWWTKLSVKIIMCSNSSSSIATWYRIDDFLAVPLF